MYCCCLLQTTIAVLALFTLVQAQSNVCEIADLPKTADFCAKHRNAHLGCNNKGFWYKKCGDVKHMIFMSKEYRQLIVRMHNSYRNTVAKGKFKNIPMAARMLRLRWDFNLAKLADYAARRCKLNEPSKIFSTPQYSDPGFNSAVSKFPRNELQSEKSILKSHLQIWFDQNKHLTYKNLKADVSPNCQETAHVKQMLVGVNSGIGCAMARFSDEHWVYQTTICLYGCRKQRQKRPYLVGKVPGNNCKCGVAHEYKCLCRYGEPAPANCVEEKVSIPIVETTTTRKPKTKPSKKKVESNVGRFIRWLVEVKGSQREIENEDYSDLSEDEPVEDYVAPSVESSESEEDDVDDGEYADA